MARERKPLIEPGSVLPGADTLSRILERDRTSSGRRPPGLLPPEEVGDKAQTSQSAPAEPVAEAVQEAVAPLPAAPNITSNITAHTRIREENSADDLLTSNARIRADTQKDAKPGTQASAKADGKKVSKADARMGRQEAALASAKQMSASRPIPITLRLPEDLNDWLDEYAHSHRKQGIKKQDLIARAVQLLVVELSAEEAEGNGDAP